MSLRLFLLPLLLLLMGTAQAGPAADLAAEGRMAEARRQAAVHVPFAERPIGAAAVRAELDAELVRFFAAAMRDRRG